MTENWLLLLSEILGVVAVTWIVSKSPRWVLPRVSFRLPQRDGYLALGLFGSILALAFVYWRTSVDTRLLGGMGNWERPFLSLLALTLFVVTLLLLRQPLSAVGWNMNLLRQGALLGLSLAILTVFLQGKLSALLDGITPLEGQMLAVCAVLALAEETIFRGFIQPRLQAWLGRWIGLVLGAVLFALWTLPTALQLSGQVIALTFALSFVQGLVLGWVMDRSGHVLAPALYRTISFWIGLV